MAFEKDFLSGRKSHLTNKLRVTRQAIDRVGLLPMHRHYKRTVLLPQILAALERLEQGTYGICPGCLEGIPEERLLRHPHVLRCVPCQEAHDLRNGHRL